jgi:hypothetical protein
MRIRTPVSSADVHFQGPLMAIAGGDFLEVST